MQIRRRFTSAHLISLIALFVALGGTVYAASAINGRVIKKGSIPGNRVRAESLTGTQIDEGSLGTVPRASSADSAERAKRATEADTAKRAGEANTAKRATEADTAKKAGEATNALALGGAAASDYQRACQAGAVKGVVVVDTSATTVNQWVAFPGYNCGHQPIEVIHGQAVGEYFVKFLNGPGGPNPVVPAVVSLATGDATTGAKVRSVNNPIDQQPAFLVQVFNKEGMAFNNSTFTLVVF